MFTQRLAIQIKTASMNNNTRLCARAPSAFVVFRSLRSQPVYLLKAHHPGLMAQPPTAKKGKTVKEKSSTALLFLIHKS
jgi:hypothetical protein